jgi:Fe2+ or Zn2+ uptake regulation protein
MTQTKIEGKFYPLKSEEWLKSIKELSHSELKILYYLRSIDPYSNGVSLSPAQIARDISTEKVKVHRSTVSRALKSLDRRGFISMELIKVRVKVISQGMLSDNNGNVVTTQQCCDHATQVVPRQQTVQPHNNWRLKVLIYLAFKPLRILRLLRLTRPSRRRKGKKTFLKK